MFVINMLGGQECSCIYLPLPSLDFRMERESGARKANLSDPFFVSWVCSQGSGAMQCKGVLKALIQFDLRLEKKERITSCDVGTNQRVGHAHGMRL